MTWWGSVIGFVTGCVAATIVAVGWARRQRRRLRTVTVTAETGRVSQTAALQMTHQQLETLLHAMAEGVVVADVRGQIQLVNPSLIALLQWSDYVGRTVLECGRHVALAEMIDRAVRSDAAQSETMTVRIDQTERHLIVHVMPLRIGGHVVGTVSVMHDITALRRLEQFRTELVANISHELKTPLANIRGYAETLRTGAAADPVVAARFCEKIERHALHLQQLVDGLLQLAEAESGQLALHREEITVADCFEELRSDFAARLAEKQLTCEIHAASESVVSADRSALRQILGNLLDNAIKYTPSGGRIILAARKQENAEVQISVADTGPGIPETDLARIFERFYRVDQSRTRALGGTGLGLAIVKHLVQAHGGEVGVQSQLGEGACVFFTLDCHTNVAQ